MFCKKCGTRLLNGVSVCHACGANTHEEELAKIYNPATGGNMNDRITPNNIEPIKNEYNKPKEKSYGPIVILIILLILFVLVLIKFLG